MGRQVALLRHIIMIPNPPVFDNSSMGRHVAPLGHIIMIPNPPVFDNRSMGRHVAPLRHIIMIPPVVILLPQDLIGSSLIGQLKI
jgi:hypothetical protein